jgi:hypothetical protein
MLNGDVLEGERCGKGEQEKWSVLREHAHARAVRR